MTTFTNGNGAIASVCTDKVIIGTNVFDLSGNVLSNFPSLSWDNSVAAVGVDKVIVGSFGAARLFGANGNLLTTFTKPAQWSLTNSCDNGMDFFGGSVASAGANMVIIGAPHTRGGCPYGPYDDSVYGRAYLFDIWGNLLTAFTNPAPRSYTGFGACVAAAGLDKILVGAPYGYGGPGSAVFLYTLGGTLLASFTNATSGFGLSFTQVGSDRVWIGNPSGYGVAYLYPFAGYATDLISDGVRAGAIGTDSLADGAITVSKLALLFSASLARLDADQTFLGRNAFSGSVGIDGSVGIGTDDPQAKLDVRGIIRTWKLHITGGADLAERFSVSHSDHGDAVDVEPGMAVSIDPTGNRKFKLSDKPYDRKRVGIISGGNGVKPGLVLQDEGNPAVAGDQPIALTGQVWCRADSSFGSISPGDLLTTSGTPGHAMKVIDFDKARFAVLGQALTGLEEGCGWVQVLVGKQ